MCRSAHLIVLAKLSRVCCALTPASPLSRSRRAGNPNTITGFVTNNTPVLLGHGERAQLGTDEYIPLTPLLEGFVIVKKNPDYEE